MRTSVPTLAFLVACSLHAVGAGAQAQHNRQSPTLESAVDARVRPGDDFFAYANGSWLKATPIPAGKDRWGARNEIDEVNRLRLSTLLDDARNAPAGSTARKVADFRAALLNDDAIEARKLASLQPLLDSIARLQDKQALTRMLGREMRADVDPLNWGVYRSASVLGLSVEPSIHGEKTNVAFLVQGGLGLPDRENYVSADTANQALRRKYRAYVERMLAVAGIDRAEQRADAVVALETAIAQSQATREKSANDHNADTVWTAAEFARQAPGMDWPSFFAAAGLATQQSLGPWQPSAVRGLAALLASEPLETWKDYLRVRALDTYAETLPLELSREALAFHAAMNGEVKTPTREERAASRTQLVMGDAIGRMYVERYFPPAQKARVQGIVANVVAAFIRRLDAVTWMSPEAKAVAVAKVKALYVGIGYPDHWSDYSDLIVDPADASGNLRRSDARDRRRTLAMLDQPVDNTQWWITPQRVGAILMFQQNAYDFSAALLQPPKFDPAASDAATYGAIGALIGHDVTHYVDVLGAEYEVDGRMRRWWSPDDVVRFKTVTAPLVKQFDGYRPYPDLAINGTLTLTENVADLGGLLAAFDAYRATLGNHATDVEHVRQQDREFFLAFAQSWRAKLSESAMRTQAATNDHAPETYRISTVRNVDAWYDAFDIRPGDRLYLPPAERARIW